MCLGSSKATVLLARLVILIIQDAFEISGVLHINTKQLFNTGTYFKKQSSNTPVIASLQPPDLSLL